jgi:hypothetical protein
VLYVGSSNFAGWYLAQANETACSRHLFGLVSEQCRHSLIARQVEKEVLSACAAPQRGSSSPPTIDSRGPTVMVCVKCTVAWLHQGNV